CANAGCVCTRGSWPASRSPRTRSCGWPTQKFAKAWCVSCGNSAFSSSRSICKASVPAASTRWSAWTPSACLPVREAIMTPLPAAKALDAYFLEARSKILDLAAILDRIGRGTDAPSVIEDPRLARVRQALEVLHDQSGGRAERIQQIFSLDYDPTW